MVFYMDIVIFGIVSLFLGFLMNISPLKKAFKFSLGLGLFVSLVVLGFLSLKGFDTGPSGLSLDLGDLLTDVILLTAIVISFIAGTFLRGLFKRKG